MPARMAAASASAIARPGFTGNGPGAGVGGPLRRLAKWAMCKGRLCREFRRRTLAWTAENTRQSPHGSLTGLGLLVGNRQAPRLSLHSLLLLTS